MSGKATASPTTQRVGSGRLFQAFHFLLKQRQKIDTSIVRMQEKLFHELSGRGNRIAKIRSPRQTKRSPRRTKRSRHYVRRMDNDLTLVEAIRGVMIPGKRMTMKQVLAELGRTGKYVTRSKLFYTMVNNKLNRDRRVKKVSRGIFMLKPPVKHRTLQQARKQAG